MIMTTSIKTGEKSMRTNLIIDTKMMMRVLCRLKRIRTIKLTITSTKLTKMRNRRASYPITSEATSTQLCKATWCRPNQLNLLPKAQIGNCLSLISQLKILKEWLNKVWGNFHLANQCKPHSLMRKSRNMLFKGIKRSSLSHFNNKVRGPGSEPWQTRRIRIAITRWTCIQLISLTIVLTCFTQRESSSNITFSKRWESVRVEKL